MKISTETNSARKLVGSEKAIELIAKAGFDAFDYSMFEMATVKSWSTMELAVLDSPLCGDDYIKYVRSIKKVGDDNGIICNQTHAPYPTQAEGMEKYTKRAIECTAELGAKYCIVHPLSLSPLQDNVRYYTDLLPFAKEHGVTIATENMFGWDSNENHASTAALSNHAEFGKIFEELSDDNLVACLDIGHAEMRGLGTSAVDMIHALGSKLCALHIHDNDKHRDLHQIPFSKNIDYDAIVKALKEINYQGYFTLEADSFLSAYTAETAFEGIKELQKSARKLADMFEAL